MSELPTERDVLERLRSMLQAFGGTAWCQDIEAAILEIEDLRGAVRNDVNRIITLQRTVTRKAATIEDLLQQREEDERLREKLQLEIARRDLTIDVMMRDLDALQELLVARSRG
jgi:hypothetical protein